ncbi:MAG: glycosyltransferase domain-containing protein [Terriglobales bacterium]
MAPWKITTVEREVAWPTLEAKRFKILPHVMLPSHEFSLWIDGRIEIIEPVQLHELAGQYLGDADIAMFAHGKRTCIYEEAWECIKQKLDDKEIIYDQIARYTRDGYPSNNGLHEASVILRRNTEQMRKFNEAWWEEIQRGSIRDQISFDYLAHKHELRVAQFPGDFYAGNRYFLRGARGSAERNHASAIHLTLTAGTI